MANLANVFSYNDVKNEYEVLPAGIYQAIITDSVMKPTKNGQGQYLELVIRITNGQYEGRLLWERLTLVHSNPTVVRIAKIKLKSICDAVSVPNLQDSEEIHNKEFSCQISIKNDPQWGDRNEINKYFSTQSATQAKPNIVSISHSQPKQETTEQPVVQQPTRKTAVKAPWAK